MGVVELEVKAGMQAVNLRNYLHVELMALVVLLTK